MISIPQRVFLDTNIYILGAALEGSAEAKILDWAGFDGISTPATSIIISDALVQQISRVARRLQNKDWAGKILSQVFHGMQIEYVVLDLTTVQQLEDAKVIPREDIEMYLTASEGRAECFVSTNHELVRMIAAYTGAFKCYTPDEFVEKYVKQE